MGFFNKMKSMAEKANKFLNDDEDDDDGPEVVNVPPPTDSSLFRMGSLRTPAPPPVPTDNRALSVRIAVNGKDYGPYERTTLREMVSNGALTPDTLVFMEGMTEWLPAHAVPEVNELFGNKQPLPKAPPIPWANAPEITPTKEVAPKESAEHYDNILSPKLNRLITAAVADGEISDLERQVLIRNAQEEGVAMDEFVMILEARLYEQRRVLQAQEDARQHAATMAQAAQRAAETPKIVAQPKADKPKKCPHCGAPVASFAASCPECGYDYNDATIGSYTPWEQLMNKLDKVNDTPQSTVGGFLRSMGIDNSVVEKKTHIIQTFPVPSDKRGLMEFFINCAPFADVKKFKAGSIEQVRLAPAYKAKAVQILTKAKILLKDDPSLLEEMYAIAKANKIKI